MQMMTNFAKGLSLSTLVLGGAMGATMLAQSPASDQSTPAATQSTPSASQSTTDPNDTTTYATGKPLQNQSKEGFWGHMNPFARKKWVARTVDPIRDRTNELDQLQAKNANDIKDVDSRATAGINKAMMAANTADQHAADAANRANTAQTTATGASTRTDQLNGTVSNLDQYSQVTSTDVKFAAGRTALGPEGKSTLDDMATKLSAEKGYIIEVQGYSKHGVATSQAMADSVVRYLVTEHQVPLYRIYRTGLGRNTETTASATTASSTANPADSQTALVNGVRVTLLHNSLATMGSASASNNAPTSEPGQTQTPNNGSSVNQ
jgi:outer membrane protein OmpA-like peptidoglycan-associated protein